MIFFPNHGSISFLVLSGTVEFFLKNNLQDLSEIVATVTPFGTEKN